MNFHDVRRVSAFSSFGGEQVCRFQKNLTFGIEGFNFRWVLHFHPIISIFLKTEAIGILIPSRRRLIRSWIVALFPVMTNPGLKSSLQKALCEVHTMIHRLRDKQREGIFMFREIKENFILLYVQDKRIPEFTSEKDTGFRIDVFKIMQKF